MRVLLVVLGVLLLAFVGRNWVVAYHGVGYPVRYLITHPSTLFHWGEFPPATAQAIEQYKQKHRGGAEPPRH